MDKETIEQLRKGHPDFMSPKDAAPFLGMSARKLSELVAEGRAPYHQLGGNIGATKRIVFIYTERLMEWQVRAEGSLFYTKYGSYETKATGMLLVCREEKRDEVAQNIIRQTMWSRKQLLSAHCSERNRPVRWSRSPIKLKAQYEHVYLTTPNRIQEDVWSILREEGLIRRLSGDKGVRLGEQDAADIELWPRRLFVSPATDLLK